MRGGFFDAIALLAAGQALATPVSRNLSAIHPGLHELRLKDRAGKVRVFSFVKRGEAIYMLHAFRKKTQELPRNGIDIVLKRIKEI
ncbi:MAG: type II toxin-antitoxin system RelE/ParE family toxin [Oligoflexia bacterium]|nr:type II toxin-antitoxin system RelE/ParE family toxin [Oligoflexia bacterium]